MPVIRASTSAAQQQLQPSGCRLGLGNYALYDYGNTDTLWYVPFTSNVVQLYTGSNWAAYELSSSIYATTSGLSQNANHDVFLNDASGTLTLSFVAWSSDTSRATALAQQNGVWVKNAAPTYLYLGTVRVDASGYLQDQAGDASTGGRRRVWNCYNRRPRPLYKWDTTDSWTYTTATWRQARANAANQVDYVCGLDAGYDQHPVSATVQVRLGNSVGAAAAVGVGVDSTSSNSASLFGGGATSVAQTATAVYRGSPGAGYHYLAWLEISQAVGTTTWYGDNGLTYWTHGIVAEVWA